MIAKHAEKIKAVQLRKEGKTYSEILAQIPVAKSSLSLWLREVGLAKRQLQRITEKKLAAARKGGEAKLSQRIQRYTALFEAARTEIGAISNRELFIIGIVLYWAEGGKERTPGKSSGFLFGNMDPKMLLIMLEWLERVCKIKKTVVGFELYLHETHRHRLAVVQQYWTSILDISPNRPLRVYFKKGSTKLTNRKNIGETYFGLIRLRVPKSSDIVRKIAGWTEGIVQGIKK